MYYQFMSYQQEASTRNTFYSNMRIVQIHMQIAAPRTFLRTVFIQVIDCLPLSLCRYPPRPTRTSIAYGVHVDDEHCDGLKDFLDIFNRAKCSGFSCNKLLHVNRSIITRTCTCTRRRCHIPLPCFRLTHLWEVFCVTQFENIY